MHCLWYCCWQRFWKEAEFDLHRTGSLGLQDLKLGVKQDWMAPVMGSM